MCKSHQQPIKACSNQSQELWSLRYDCMQQSQEIHTGCCMGVFPPWLTLTFEYTRSTSLRNAVQAVSCHVSRAFRNSKMFDFRILILKVRVWRYGYPSRIFKHLERVTCCITLCSTSRGVNFDSGLLWILPELRDADGGVKPQLVCGCWLKNITLKEMEYPNVMMSESNPLLPTNMFPPAKALDCSRWMGLHLTVIESHKMDGHWRRSGQLRRFVG